MAFDEFAPRMKLKARQVRQGDYLRVSEDRWKLAKFVDLTWPDAALELEGRTTLSFDKDAEVEVSSRTRWVEVEGRYRIVDTFPYLEREDEYSDLSLAEAAAKMEDLTPIQADDILSDFDEPDVDRWQWTDEEIGRIVSLLPEVEPIPNRKVPPPTPEAAATSPNDGLNRLDAAEGEGRR